MIHKTRPATPADETFLAELYREVHRDEFAPLGLPEAQLEGLLAMQFRAQKTGYARDYPLAADRILLDDQTGEPIGRILVHSGDKNTYLIDIALVAQARGKGLGSALLEQMIVDARRSGLPIRLMVQPGNRAFALYSRLGFRLIGGGVTLEMEFSPAAEPDSPTPPADAPRAGAEWDARVGREFRLGYLPDGTPFVLRLVSVTRPRWEGRSFALLFHGNLAPVLPQAMYDFVPAEADEGAAAETIFIVPVGPRGDAMQYEAIFN